MMEEAVNLLVTYETSNSFSRIPFNSFVRRLIYYNDQHDDHVDDDVHDDEDK